MPPQANCGLVPKWILTKENYEYVAKEVDIANLIDYEIAEIYFSNYDWPCNNNKIWKGNTDSSKWRFLVYDLDYSLGYDYDGITGGHMIVNR